MRKLSLFLLSTAGVTAVLAVTTMVAALIVGGDPAWDSVGESLVAATLTAFLATLVTFVVFAIDKMIDRAVNDALDRS